MDGNIHYAVLGNRTSMFPSRERGSFSTRPTVAHFGEVVINNFSIRKFENWSSPRLQTNILLQKLIKSGYHDCGKKQSFQMPIPT